MKGRYSDRTILIVTSYRKRRHEMHCGRKLSEYEWYQYLMDIEFVGGRRSQDSEDGNGVEQWAGYSFEQFYAVLLELDLYPEMLDILVDRHRSFNGISHRGHPSNDVIADFYEFLRFKHGAGFLVPMAMTMAIKYVMSGQKYDNGIRDEAFIADLKSEKFGELGASR